MPPFKVQVTHSQMALQHNFLLCTSLAFYITRFGYNLCYGVL